jgi:hypothetical protein
MTSFFFALPLSYQSLGIALQTILRVCWRPTSWRRYAISGVKTGRQLLHLRVFIRTVPMTSLLLLS